MKLNYLYIVKHINSNGYVLDMIIQVTKVFPMSDVFNAIDIKTGHNKFSVSLRTLKQHWIFDEIGPKEDYPELFL